MRLPGQSVGRPWSQWLWTCGRAHSLSVLVLVVDLLVLVHLLRFDEGSSVVEVDVVVVGLVAFRALPVVAALPLVLAHVPVVLAQATLDIFVLCNDWMVRMVRMVVGSIGKPARDHSKIVTKALFSLPPVVSDDENIYLHEMHAPSGHYMQYRREMHDLVLVTARLWIRSRPFDQLVILTVLRVQRETLCLQSRVSWCQWLQIVVRTGPVGSRSLACYPELLEIPGMWPVWRL